MDKKILLIAICCLLLAVLGGCAASQTALQTVKEKANALQQKAAKALGPKEEQAPTAQKKSAAKTPTTQKECPTPPPKKAAVATVRTASPPPIKDEIISPGYTYCKSPRNSFYQAYLSPEWNHNAFKFISINGLRYSRRIILNYVNDPKNDTIFFLKEDKGLGVELNEHFDIEIAFYPPDKKDHEEFKPFKVIVINRDDEVKQSEEIISRMKKYRISR